MSPDASWKDIWEVDEVALANRRWLCYCVGPRIDLGLNNPMVYQFPHTGFLWFFVWKLVPGRNFFVWVYPIFKHTQNSYYVHHIYIMHIFLNDIHIPIILPWYTSYVQVVYLLIIMLISYCKIFPVQYIYIYQYLWFQYQLPLDVILAEGCIWTHAVPSVGAMAQSTTWWVGLRT